MGIVLNNMLGGNMNQLQVMAAEFLAAIPNVVKALLLALLTWILAVIVRNIIVKGGKKLRLPAAMQKARVVKDEEKGFGILKTLGSFGFFVTVLLMAPSVLEALNVQSVSQPLSNMVTGFFAFIPNIIGACIILFIGYLLAKVARELVTNFAQTMGSDKLASKIDGVEDSGEFRLSKVIGMVIFALIIIPVVIASLETLGIASISAPAVTMLEVILGMIPNIVAAVLIILIGVAIAKFVEKLLLALLVNSGVDKLFRSAVENQEKYASFKVSEILAKIVKFLIVAFFVIESLSVMNLTVLTTVGAALVAYLPNVVAAIVILLVAFLAAKFVGKAVKSFTQSQFLEGTTKALIYIFAIFMTLSQLNLATEIVNTAFYFILGAVALAFVLAFGLGGKDFAKKQLEKFDRRIDEEIE